MKSTIKNNKEEATKITSQNFVRLLKYASRQHLNDVVDFLQTNQLNIVSDLPTVQSMLTPETIYHCRCDDFVKACYYFHYGYEYHPTSLNEQSYIEEFKRFDINQLLLNGSDKVKLNKYDTIYDYTFEFNFPYIRKVVDQVAHKYGYDFIPWTTLQNLSLNMKELNQDGVALRSVFQGEAFEYKCYSIVASFYDHQYYSSEIEGMYLKMEK